MTSYETFLGRHLDSCMDEIEFEFTFGCWSWNNFQTIKFLVEEEFPSLRELVLRCND